MSADPKDVPEALRLGAAPETPAGALVSWQVGAIELATHAGIEHCVLLRLFGPEGTSQVALDVSQAQTIARALTLSAATAQRYADAARVRH